MSASHTHQSGGPLSLISCVSARETSPSQEDVTVEVKTETKKKRFHPLRNLRRMFRRKARHSIVSNSSSNADNQERTLASVSLELRSNSTSRLLEDDQNPNRRKNSGLAPGLSLSHDSVFTPDRPDSGQSSSDLDNSSLSIPVLLPVVRAELVNAMRKRHRFESDDDEDLGLPKSPSSLTTPESKTIRDQPVKSHSSCSEGSLLSMDSSEMEEDSYSEGVDLDVSISSPTHRLSHSAAKHKMAVRPKRNHGAPNSKRRTVKPTSILPTTPEVNEESIHHTSVTRVTQTSVTMTTESVSTSTVTSHHAPGPPMLDIEVKSTVNPQTIDVQLKSSSLPAGLATRNSPRVTRSQSNVCGGKPEINQYKRSCSDDLDDPKHFDLYDDKKEESSFFGRFLSRRSGKKKKKDEEEKRIDMEVVDSGSDEHVHFTKKPCTKNHSGLKTADRRQRVEPIEIPSSPVLNHGSLGRNRMKISYSMSPPKPTWPSGGSPPKWEYSRVDNFLPSHKESWDLDNDRANILKDYTSNWENDVQVLSEHKDLSPLPFSKREVPAKLTKSDSKPVSELNDKTKASINLSSSPQKYSEMGRDMNSKPPTPVIKQQSFKKELNFPTGSGLPGDKKRSNEVENVKITTKMNVRHSDESLNEQRHYLKNKISNVTKVYRKDEKDNINTKLTADCLVKKSSSLDSIECRVTETVNTSKSISTDGFHKEPEYANLPLIRKDDHGYENSRIVDIVKLEDKQKRGEETVPEFMRVQLNKVENRNSNLILSMSEKNEEDSGVKTVSIVSVKIKTPPGKMVDEYPKSSFRKLSNEENLFSEKKKVSLENKVETPKPAIRKRPEVSPEKKRPDLEIKVESLKPIFRKQTTEVTDRKRPELETKAEPLKPLRKFSSESKKPEEELPKPVFRKQTSSSEIIQNKIEEAKKRFSLQEEEKTKVLVQKPEENMIIIEPRRDSVEEVVLRKKSTCRVDDEPELMKVFARRSLKIKDDESDTKKEEDESNRSRDSDKENENSPKEERKKLKTDDIKKPIKNEKPVTVKTIEIRTVNEVKVNVTPLKPTVSARNTIVSRFARSLSENGVKTPVISLNETNKNESEKSNKFNDKSSRWSSVLQESDVEITTKVETELKDSILEEEKESGFKRIQDRKAEWEKRLQQASK